MKHKLLVCIGLLICGVVAFMPVRGVLMRQPVKVSTPLTKQELARRLKDYYNVQPFSHTQLDDPQIEGLIHHLSDSFVSESTNSRTAQQGAYVTQDAEAKFVQFVSDTDINRELKLGTLWQLANRLEGDQKYFVLDYLELLDPVELTPEFIAAFNGLIDSAFKSRLIRLMATALEIANPETESKDQLDFIARQGIAVWELLHDQLSNSSDVTVLKQALWYYPAVAEPTEAVSTLQQVLARGTAVPVDSVLNSWVGIAFSDVKQQDTLVPEFLEQLDSQTAETRHIVQTSMYPFTQTGEISNTVKDALGSYLEKNEPKTFDPSVYRSYLGWMEDRYNWFDSYARMKTKDETEKTSFMLDAVNASRDFAFQAAMIAYLPADTIQTMSPGNRAAIAKHFTALLNGGALTEDQTRLFEYTLMRLQ